MTYDRNANTFAYFQNVTVIFLQLDLFYVAT